MRDVRHVSAALPHLSPHARRGRIAARPHLADPGHEQRAPLVLPRTRRAPRSLPRLPRVRVGLSVGRALRRDHRWRTGTGRRATPSSVAMATAVRTLGWCFFFCLVVPFLFWLCLVFCVVWWFVFFCVLC